MKHLSKIPSYVWLLLTLVFGLIFTISYWVFTMNVENEISTNIIVSKDGSDTLVINAIDSLLIKKKTKLRLRIRNEFYNVTVQSIKNTEDGKVEIYLIESNDEFVPGSTMSAKIIYSSIPVWQKITRR